MSIPTISCSGMDTARRPYGRYGGSSSSTIQVRNSREATSQVSEFWGIRVSLSRVALFRGMGTPHGGADGERRVSASSFCQYTSAHPRIPRIDTCLGVPTEVG